MTSGEPTVQVACKGLGEASQGWTLNVKDNYEPLHHVGGLKRCTIAFLVRFIQTPGEWAIDDSTA